MDDIESSKEAYLSKNEQTSTPPILLIVRTLLTLFTILLEDESTDVRIYAVDIADSLIIAYQKV